MSPDNEPARDMWSEAFDFRLDNMIASLGTDQVIV